MQLASVFTLGIAAVSGQEDSMDEPGNGLCWYNSTLLELAMAVRSLLFVSPKCLAEVTEASTAAVWKKIRVAG